jgi:6-phosphogluconolactonase
MVKEIIVLENPVELAERVASDIAFQINSSASEKKSYTIALSGGSTPDFLYKVLGDKYSRTIKWEYVHFFWGDERCVPPGDMESNYRPVEINLFQKVIIPLYNIHRVIGEASPADEAKRYSAEILENVGSLNGFPSFDLVLLGLGEDGHTASIFPDNMKLLDSDKICEVAVHPESGQNRITMCGKVLNNSKKVVFLVSGKKKAGIVKKILNMENESMKFPAAHINPPYGKLIWLIDKEAASLI